MFPLYYYIVKRIFFYLQFSLSLFLMIFALYRATDIVYPVRFGKPADKKVIERQVREGNLSMREALFYSEMK